MDNIKRVSIKTEGSSQPEIIINPRENFDAKFDYYMEAWKHAMKEEYRPDVNETVNEWLEQFEKYMKKGGEK